MGSAPGALRGVMQALERAIVETGHAWEQAVRAHGEVPEIIGAVDETFFERLLLVLLDLPPGDLWWEEAVEDRSSAPWKALVDKRLEALRAPVRSRVSDRAQALIPRAEQGLECLSIPDVFHLMHDIGQNDALALGRQLRQARQAWQKAQDGLQRHQAREPWAPRASLDATRQGETAQAEVRAGQWSRASSDSDWSPSPSHSLPCGLTTPCPRPPPRGQARGTRRSRPLPCWPTPSSCRSVRPR